MYLDLVKFALIFALTGRHACRILYIDKHVHEDCHNDSGNHIKYGVLFKNMVDKIMLTIRTAEPIRMTFLSRKFSLCHTAKLTAMEL